MPIRHLLFCFSTISPMTQATPQQTKLQALLRELFQLDQPDLDFGLYRIMHAKSREIAQFIEHDLLSKIQQLDNTSQAEKIAQAKANYERERQTAIDYGGNPDAPKVQQALAEYQAAQAGQADDAELFDHLYKFFERYYDGGDFLARRYYARETSEKAAPYAVPYDGSEVYLHWANKDQYYIKTAENFRQFSVDLSKYNQQDIIIQADAASLKLHFEIVDAEEGAHNNVKAAGNQERYFILDAVTPLEWRGIELVARFHYRADPDKTGTAGKWRETLNAKNEQAILAALAQLAQGKSEQAEAAQHFHQTLATPISKGKDGTQTVLAKYLNQYTAKNSMDYFIHKNLGGFLKRELDFYIKNELFRLDDLGNVDAPNPQQLEKLLKKALTLRDVAHKLIEFLAQTEEFQKKLWLKKKFVVDTQWLVTLDKVPAALYAQIEGNDAQWSEWEKLGFVVSNAKRKALLKPDSKLVLDTQFFAADFTAQVLASIENLDDATDGVLVHSENFQALNLMQARYREQVKCIYIDPPYNTGSDDNFSYKDAYKSSSWLAMFNDRLLLARRLLNEKALVACHMDEHEHQSLEWLIKQHFGDDGDLGKLVWDKRNPKGDAKGVAAQHEYVHFAAQNLSHLKNDENAFVRNKKNAEEILLKAEQLIKQGNGVTEQVRAQFKTWINSQDFSGGEKAYCLIDDECEVYRPVSMAWPNKKRAPDEYFIPLIHPTTKQACPVPMRGWRNPPETMTSLERQGLILFGDDETTQPNRKYLLKNNLTESVPSLYYMGGSDDALFGNMGLAAFENPKPVKAASYFLSIIARPSDSICIDYFSGSGTTGHAVININREDNGKRKYLLVEMGNYFDTVLKPRIAKVIYAADWKEGKPVPSPQPSPQRGEGVNFAGVSQLVKVIRLESYEDTLNNLQLSDCIEQYKDGCEYAALREAFYLQYLLSMETQGSPSLLNIKLFADPTAYSLNLKQPGSEAQKARAVDLVETFNWLLGLRVRKLHAPQTFTATFAQEVDAELPAEAQGRWVVKRISPSPLPLAGEGNAIWWFRAVEGIAPATGGREQRVLIVWRKLTVNLEQDNLVLETYLREVLKLDVYQPAETDPQVVYVNGSHALPSMPHCEVRQLEEAFHQLMWEAQDV